MYDYRYEPHHLIFMTDNKIFFASCEAFHLGLNPMEACLAVVSRQPDSCWGSGLVMAASPLAKKKYGLHNVMRVRQLPPKQKASGLKLVEPHMNPHTKRSTQVLDIPRKYAVNEDTHVYSIDGGIIDMIDSWRFFGNDPYYVARRTQKDIHDALGPYTTRGIGENPFLARLAVDNSAKHKKSMLAFRHYLDVPDIVWKMEKLEDVWGINTRTANRLRKIGINNMHDLAHSKPYLLKKESEIIGEQLLAESWGVDRSIIGQKYHPKSKRYGNSQVLTRDYFNQREMELVIREIGEQVTARIRAHDLRVGKVSLYIGFSLSQLAETTRRGGSGAQRKITPTNVNHDLVKELIALFRGNRHRENVRTISVSYTGLLSDGTQQLNMFEDFDLQIKRYKLDHIVDQIRKEYGFTLLVKASSLLKGATAIERSNLAGGHNGGNIYG